MQNNSEGLSPGLKPFLGVGHNRALPAPFGFGKGIQPDANDDYFNISGILGKSVFSDFTFEIFLKKPEGVPGGNGRGLFAIETDNGKNIEMYVNSYPTIQISGNDLGGSIYFNITDSCHLVLRQSNGVFSVVINAGFSSQYIQNLNFVLAGLITKFWLFSRNNGGVAPDYLFDEFRFYNKRLSDAEISLNYNNGIGENPCQTEDLLIWYNFDQFENLDFSLLQDNTDIRLGMRDLSGKNNHAQPINMDTNPASPNYVLKPF